MDALLYRDKVRGCWLGKCLAGAIGMPYEGVPYTVELKEEDIHLSDVPNDDLELQLVWMDCLKRHGAKLTYADIAQAWTQRIQHGCDEYSAALHNMAHGILPPASGLNNNFFVDGMGATIRSEIWALAFCGRMDAVAHFAQMDAEADHWGDGVRGEIFMALAEAHALIHSDIEAALRFALQNTSPDSRLYKAVAQVFSLYDEGVDDEEARKQLLLTQQRHPNFTDCVMNLSFIVHALLRNKGEFLRTVISVISFGRDTDCTAASCGAFLGVALGMAAFPEKWRGAVSDSLSLSDFVRRIPGVPTSLQELEAQTIALHERLMQELPKEAFAPYAPYVPASALPTVDRSRWLILSSEDGVDPAQIEAQLAQTGRCPEIWAEKVVSFDSLVLDLSAYAKNAQQLHLFSFLTVNHAKTPPEEILLSATADVGMRLNMDGRMLMNHHSRQKMLPSFHRAEGGAAFNLPLSQGSRHLFHVELFSCLPPLKLCIMFGNRQNDHLDGFDFSIE